MTRRTGLAALAILAFGVAAVAQEPASTPAAPAQAPAAEPAPAPAAAAPAPAPAAPVQAPAPAPVPTAQRAAVPQVFLEKLSVVVDGKAEYAGQLKIEFEPVGGPAKAVEVRVLAKSKAKEIAKEIHKELTIAAGSAYKVKLSGDEVRLAKANKKSPNFSVTIKELAISGVSVRVQKG